MIKQDYEYLYKRTKKLLFLSLLARRDRLDIPCDIYYMAGIKDITSFNLGLTYTNKKYYSEFWEEIS